MFFSCSRFFDQQCILCCRLSLINANKNNKKYIKLKKINKQTNRQKSVVKLHMKKNIQDEVKKLYLK